jgi:hypothetical protein
MTRPRSAMPPIPKLLIAIFSFCIVFTDHRAFAGPVNTAAARVTSSKVGYRQVITEMKRWHGTRTNACVAFIATALNQVMYGKIPDEAPNGPWSNPARVTFALDEWMASESWTKHNVIDELVTGDIVFTSGAPDHVMLFHGWADRAQHIAYVSDNQGHDYQRWLDGNPQKKSSSLWVCAALAPGRRRRLRSPCRSPSL